MAQTEPKVFIVDDDATIRSLLKRLVIKAGHRPWDAATSEEAMMLLRESSFGFDLILLDMVLPGHSGMECLREIRRDWPNLPVIVISGWLSVQSRAAAALESEMGVSCFLPKPFDVGELSARMSEALSNAS